MFLSGPLIINWELLCAAGNTFGFLEKMTLHAEYMLTPAQALMISKRQPVQQDDLINVDETYPLGQVQTFPFPLYFLRESAIDCDV